MEAGFFPFPEPWLVSTDVGKTASSHPGPNAPLSDACHNSQQPSQNAESAFASWTAAGFPPSKLVLGVPSYGYISRSNVTELSERGDVRVISDEGDQVQFRDLVSEGALQMEPSNQSIPWNAAYGASGGFRRYWDACSSTPFLQSSEEQQVIVYDDPESLYKKAAFVASAGMRGVNLFDLSGDTDTLDLINSLRYGLGLS
jgi:chitinase